MSDVTGQIVPTDGKTLVCMTGLPEKRLFIYMISARASENGITTGQVKTDEKPNEVTEIQELLKVPAPESCIVTIDATGCQKKTAELITDRGEDYVPAVKGSEESL